MKKIKLILILLSITLSITNCGNEDDLNVDIIKTKSTYLTNIHNQMKQKFNNFSIASATQKSSYSKVDNNKLKEYIDKVFTVNYEYAIANGVENLFIEYGLNPNIIDVAEWAIQNINDEELYSKLYYDFSINNQSEANLLFYSIALRYINSLN